MDLPGQLSRLRVALVHDWLVTYRGGERVLEAIAGLFPDAPIATLFHAKGAMPGDLERHPVLPSWLDRIPGARRRHRLFFPLMPAAIRTLKLPEVDVVISSSHAVAKAIPVPPGARHLSYVHATMRYMWDRFSDYFGPGRAPLPVRAVARTLRPAFQAWDVATSTGVDRFLANSRHVARQIAQRYRRFARVVHPPVELSRFTALPVEGGGRGGYFLWVGALAPYKRIDVALDAFAATGHTLYIAGAGQDEPRLRRLPRTIKVLGQVPDAELPGLYHGARALVFPGVEDFGLTPLEAQACGRPVIAYAQGGVLETVTPSTGLLMPEQSSAALRAALRQFDDFEQRFDPRHARDQALRFTPDAFRAALVEELLALVG